MAPRTIPVFNLELPFPRTSRFHFRNTKLRNDLLRCMTFSSYCFPAFQNPSSSKIRGLGLDPFWGGQVSHSKNEDRRAKILTVWQGKPCAKPKTSAAEEDQRRRNIQRCVKLFENAKKAIGPQSDNQVAATSGWTHWEWQAKIEPAFYTQTAPLLSGPAPSA